MWRSSLLATGLVLVASASVTFDPPTAAAQAAPIPRTPGWELIMRCVICHSVEIAVQQRLGPQGWSDTLDRMITYGAPIPPGDKRRLLAYLLTHYRDPAGR
jgi:cytochrome c2